MNKTSSGKKPTQVQIPHREVASGGLWAPLQAPLKYVEADHVFICISVDFFALLLFNLTSTVFLVKD